MLISLKKDLPKQENGKIKIAIFDHELMISEDLTDDQKTFLEVPEDTLFLKIGVGKNNKNYLRLMLIGKSFFTHQSYFDI